MVILFTVHGDTVYRHILFTVHGDTVYCYCCCLLCMVILFTVHGDSVYCLLYMVMLFTVTVYCTW